MAGDLALELLGVILDRAEVFVEDVCNWEGLQLLRGEVVGENVLAARVGLLDGEFAVGQQALGDCVLQL